MDLENEILRDVLKETNVDDLFQMTLEYLNDYAFMCFASEMKDTQIFYDWANEQISDNIPSEELVENYWTDDVSCFDTDTIWGIICDEFNQSIFKDFAQIVSYTTDETDLFYFVNWAIDTLAENISIQTFVEDGYFNEDVFISKIQNVLSQVQGEFYVTGTDKFIEDELSENNLCDAIGNAISYLSEGINQIIINESGNILFDCTNMKLERERFAMNGEYEFDLYVGGLTDYAKSLIK